MIARDANGRRVQIQMTGVRVCAWRGNGFQSHRSPWQLSMFAPVGPYRNTDYDQLH